MKSTACSLCATLALLMADASLAQDASDFAIKTNNGTISIVGYKGTNTTLVVPATFGDLRVTSVEWLNPKGWGGYCGGAQRVVLPETVTNLGYCLFEGCGQLTEVNIPHGITTIYCDMFIGCCVTNLVLPGHLLSIDRNAFVGASLGRLVIPDSVTNIGACAFYDAHIREFVLPHGVTNIATWLFGCNNIYNVHVNSLVLRAGIRRIDDRGFMWLEGLTNVTFEGDAPETGQDIFATNQNVTVYYYPGTKGWSTTFGGRPTAIWNPQTNAPANAQSK